MRKRKFLVFLTAIIMLISLFPAAAMAATWNDVDTWEELEQAFGDTDNTVVINLTGDIDFLDALLTLQGTTYTINGTEYTLTHVFLGGDGNVEINANVAGDYDAALSVYQNVTLTINGDIETANGQDAIYSVKNTNVTVNGNIDAGGTGVNAQEDAQVTVNGMITARGDGVYAADDANVTVNDSIAAYGDGVSGHDDSSVTVTGNINAEDTGIYASDNTTVTVTGNVTGEDGIHAYDNSSVTVTGDVSGKSGDAESVDMSDPTDYSDGGDGISAADSAQVEVNGNVTGGDAYGTYGYAGNAINALDSSAVTVTGNTTGGSVIADPDVPAVGNQISISGAGVSMSSTAKVTVNGDVTAGTTNGDSGLNASGAQIILVFEEQPGTASAGKSGSLTVGGSVSGGSADSDLKAINFDTDSHLYDPQTISADDSYAARFMKDAIVFMCQRFEIAEIADQAAPFIPGQLGYASVEDLLEDEQYITTMENISKGELLQFYTDLYDLYQTIPADAYILPQLTVWSVEGGDTHSETYSSQNFDDVVVQLLAQMTLYTVKVQQPAEGGTISTSVSEAQAGQTVVVTPTPAEGYSVSKVFLSGQEILPVNGVYSFTVPENGAMLVTAEFEKNADPAAPGGDAPKTGDDSGIMLWIVLAAVCTAAIGVLVFMKKRENAK